jgi:WD40 repeat protein
MDGMNRPWPHVRLSVGNNKTLGVQSLAFSSDGSTLACRSRGGSIRVWNRENGQQMECASPGPFSFGNLSFSPDNKVLACDGSGKSLRLYDVSSGTCIQSFRGHQGAITSISFSASNRQLLASGSTDSTVRIWNRSKSSSQEQAILSGHLGAVYSIAISPNGQYLASGGTDRILRVWDLEKVMNNHPHDFCQDLNGHEMTIVEVAFPSNHLVVSASLDMTVRLWSQQCRTTTSPREPKRRAGEFSSFACHQIIQLDSEALTMRVSSDGKLLAVGMSTDFISVWNLDDLVAEDDEDGDNKKDHSPVSTMPGKLVSFAPRTMAISGKDGSIQLRDYF